MGQFRTSSHAKHEFTDGRHRFEHWYRDNTVYFITARCRDRFPAFTSEEAKTIFWHRFDNWTQKYGFVPWVTTLLNNHYHTLGYLKLGNNLGPLMQRLHGSIAKLVNDLLPDRRVPFWRDRGPDDYFDGCIRNEKQCRRAYRYVLTQATRHGLCTRSTNYPHTRVNIDVDRAVRRAIQLRAFVEMIPYPRYER